MDEKIIEIAAAAIKVSKDEVIKHYKEIPEINALYFWDNKRGGSSVIIGADGSKLGATSSISYEKHLSAYKAGKRN